MSVQPVQRVNRVDFVVVLVTGVLFELGIVPLLPVKQMPAAQNIPQVSVSGLSFWLALFSALVVAYTAGRLINVVTMELWRRKLIRGCLHEHCPEFLKIKPHRAVFVDELEYPSRLDDHLVLEFINLVDDSFGVEGPFFSGSGPVLETECGSEDDDSDCEHTFRQVDPESLWPFVLSYVRIHGGDFVIYLQTVFRFTRNSTVLFFGLAGLYAGVWLFFICGFYRYKSPYTSLDSVGMLLVPVLLVILGLLFLMGAVRNRDDCVAYLISDFVSLRAAEDE